MRFFVTGASGFIGSTLVDRLLAEGNEVTGVDNFDPFYPRPVKERNLRAALQDARFRLCELDIREAAAVDRVVREATPEVIVHLAARAGVRPSIEDPALYTSVNVLGTVHWLPPPAPRPTRPPARPAVD